MGNIVFSDIYGYNLTGFLPYDEKFLLKLHGYELNGKEKQYYISLVTACYNKSENVAMDLLRFSNKDTLKLQDHNGNTILMIACRNRMERVAMKILEDPVNCGLNLRNEEGYTAQMYAHVNELNNVLSKCTNVA